MPESDKLRSVDTLFAGGGEMGALMRSQDWSRTPLGAVESWSYSLRTLVSMMLSNDFGMLIFWGPDLVQIYNDAYRPILGSLKHPYAMGQCARDCWREIWDVINPMFEQVISTEKAVSSEDLVLYINRNGFLEETHFIYSYSPLRDDDSRINGILVTITETTKRVLAERRGRILRNLAEQLYEVILSEQICQISTEVLTNNHEGVPFALIYLVDQNDSQANLAGASGLLPDTDFAPDVVHLNEQTDICPWAKPMQSRTMQIVTTAWEGFAEAGEWLYPEPPHTALSLPMISGTTQKVMGFLIIGISPRLVLNEKYQEFLQLAAIQIGVALNNANTYKSEQLRAQALQESEERFRTLADNIAQFAWMADEKGSIFWYNQRWFDYTGTTLDEMKDWGWRQVHHPEHVERVTEKFLKYLVTGEVWEDTFPLRRKDGEYGWFLSRAIPVKNEQGKVVRWFGTNTDITHRRQAEIALQESETRFRNMANNAPVMVWVTDATGYCTFLSQSWYDFTGQTEETGLGYGWLDASHPEDRKYAESSFITANQQKTAFHAEYRLRRKDGEYRWTIDAASPRIAADGQFEGYIGSVIDITERKEIEIERDRSLQLEQAARKQSEFQQNRLNSILLQAPAFIAIGRGRECKFEFANTPYYEITGNRELIGRTAREAFPEVEGQGFFELLEQVFDTGETFFGEEMSILLNRRGDGSLDKIFVNFTYQPLYDSDNIIEGILCFGFEVTNQVVARQQAESLAEELKAEQAALQKSQAHVNRLVEANNFMGVILTEADGTISEANEAFLRMVGYTREELQNREINWKAMTPPEYIERDNQAVKELISFGNCTAYEKEYLCKDGSRLPILIGATPLEDGQRESNWVCFVLDLTEAKKVEVLLRKQAEELSRINQVKDEFLATISHELRTPLNAILGYATMLRSRRLDEAKTERALETIERSARAQNQLINDLLDVSRIITGKLRLDVRPLTLVSLIEIAIDSIRPAAEAKNIRIQSILAPNLGFVSGDSDRLQQVLWNLLTNAIKFTPKDGQVQIRLQQVNSHIEVTVSDSGQGISPEFLPYVFDRLQQADSKNTRVHGGLGLGLAIVRHLIELHGGNVYADSAGEGLGATFTINLPIMVFRPDSKRTVQAHPIVSEVIPLSDAIRLEGMKILIVDDELDARELLAAVLSTNGAEVQIAASASDALNLIMQCTPEQLPDLLVSDIGMPEVNGYMFIRQVRDLAPEQGGKIPAIALTAYARTQDRIMALSSGFQSHVPKPVEPEEFVAVVASFIRL
jgi:PAS domain S-box-containing protein